MSKKDEVKKVIFSVGEEMGYQPTGEELEDYADYVLKWDEEAGHALNVKCELPPTDSSGDRSSYRPDPSENKYNAWHVKCNIQQKTTGKLAGKRIAIKDNINVAGIPMMDGSNLFSDYVSEYDATLVTRILQEGGIIAGKSVCEDICFSGASHTAFSGPVRNPNDITRSTGGSSSGSAALVAAGEVDMAIGADQGGSIRIPSSWCGIVGLKPTLGLVPYTGAMPMDPQVDHVGPMTSTVYDCALLLEVIAGGDGMDYRQPTNLEVPPYSKNLSNDVSKMKVALLQEGFAKCEAEVVDTVRAAVDLLRPHLAAVDEVSIPLIEDYHSFYLAGLVMGFHEVQMTYGGTCPQFGGFQDTRLQSHVDAHLKERFSSLSPTLKLVTYGTNYLKQKYGLKLRSHCVNCLERLRKEVSAVLEKYDAIIMPTLPLVACEIPADGASVKDKLKAAFNMIPNTPMFNSTHHPALTITAGKVRGLPVGMMIAGKHWHEQTVLNLAYAWEQIRDKK